jgi:hypothetical protein
MVASLPQRRALLAAALGFMRVHWSEPGPPAAAVLTAWMDSWRGVGAVVVGMTAQGFNVELREYPEAWRELLPDRRGALDRPRVRVGTDIMARRSTRRLGRAPRPPWTADLIANDRFSPVELPI